MTGKSKSGRHRISKWSLAYYSQFSSTKKRQTRGHERAAQKRAARREQDADRDTET